MEGGLGDVLQCEEQLKNTLHNNDKDKLRRKLAVLQKEYLRTVQRLKRAEHVESRRRHVRSRITLHNHHDESEADVKPTRSSVAEEEGSEGCKGPQPGLEQIPQLSHGVAASLQKNPLRSQGVHFSLMPDGAYSPTSDSSQDSAQIPRSSPAHRLRSRGSRIRWAERSAEADQSTANSKEEPKNRDQLCYTEQPVLHENTELYSSSENQTPSLLLPHWNLQGCIEKEETTNHFLTLERRVEAVLNSQEQPPNPNSYLIEEKNKSVRNDSEIHAENILKNKEDHTVKEVIEHQPSFEKGIETISKCKEKSSSPLSLLLEVKYVSLQKDHSTEMEDIFNNGNNHSTVRQMENDEAKNHRLILKEDISKYKDKTMCQIHSELEEFDEKGKHQVEECKDEKVVIVKQPLSLKNGVFLLSETKVSPSNDKQTFQSNSEYIYANETYQTEEKNMRTKSCIPHPKAIRDERSPTRASVRTDPGDAGQRLVDSCTLVDGLLFPAEYYIRTTRRMSMLRSQPDTSAVILSHLHGGRQRRAKGRGRSTPLKRAISEDGSVLKVSKDCSSPSSCRFLSGGSVGSALRRGKSGRRGRGRGLAKCRESENYPSAKDFATNVVLPSEEPRSGEVKHENAFGASSGEGAQPFNVQEICPIILQTNQGERNGVQKKAALKNWTGFLLPPSSPTFSPPPRIIPLLKNMLASDILDFHLPDDQFGSLKLLKLHQIISGVEQLISNNTVGADHCTHASPPGPFFPSPTLVTYPEHVYMGKTKVEHIKNFTCSSPKVFRSILSPEDKIPHLLTESTGIRSKDDRMPVLSDTNCAVLVESMPLETKSSIKELNISAAQCNVIVPLPRSEDQNENIETKPKISGNANSDCLNVKGNVALGSSAVFEDSPEKSFEKCEHKQTNKLKCGSMPRKMDDCEKPNAANNGGPSQLLLSPSLNSTTSQLTLPLICVPPRALPLPLVYSGPRPNVLPPSLPLTPPRAPQSHCQATVYSSPSSETLSPCLPPAETGLAERIPPERRVPRRGEGAGDATCSLKGWACARLVDVCCVPSSSGSLSVAAAGQWIVSLWSQRGPQNEWSLTHTWSFVAPVLRVFPIPDTPDCICLTLGQLEIQQVRLLSCSSLGQSLLCTRPAHLVIAASMSRVVCCSNADSSARLWILRLSDTSPAVAHALVTPGVLLSSLATVEGLPDALIGMDQSGCLYIWNMVTGHLLRKLTLGEGLSHSACLRGYSCNGALFVLLQHHRERCIDEQNEGVGTPFSLVAANPQNDKFVLATNLSLPEDCSRLSCAEALGSRVLGLSSGGSVCVWDFEESQEPRPVCGSVEGLDCHLARWGTPGILLTALHSGDVTLHYYSEGSSTVMHTLGPMLTEGKLTPMKIQTP